MDNQNNVNWPNTLNSSPPSNGTTPPPPTNLDITSSPVPPSPIFNPSPNLNYQTPTTPPNTQPWPSALDTPPANSVLPAEPSQPTPWSNPIPSNPLPDLTVPSPFPATPQATHTQPEPTWNPTSIPSPLSSPQPTPPQTFPQVPDLSNTSPTPNPSPSPLDNPWGAPSQTPAIDGSVQNNAPSWIPGQNQSPADTNPNPPLSATQPDPTISSMPSATPQDSIPTDLSHLISNNAQPENNQTPLPQSAETLVLPSPDTTPEVPTVSAESAKGGIPKWLIGVGIGLLIIVAGASAYFILGIGQSNKTPTSIPAQVQKTTVKTAPPIPTPIPQSDTPSNPEAAPQATDSTNFGQLQEGGGTQQAATSAADLIKQRQKGR